MDKKEFKKILKPLMKECIKELLMEEGMLKVISEVAQPITESKRPSIGQREQQQIESMNKTYPAATMMQDPEETKRKIQETHKKMMQEIGSSGYVNEGFNPFSNTTALASNQSPELNETATFGREAPPSLKNMDPNDPGVDIRGIMSLGNGKAWKALIGKGK